MESECINALVKAARGLKSAINRCERARSARATLPPGSTRARVTTANARWQTTAEAAERSRQELLARMANMVEEFGLVKTAQQMRDQLKQFEEAGHV